MLRTVDFKNWLKQQILDCPSFCIGTLPLRAERCIVLYDKPTTSGKAKLCIGGIEQTRLCEKQLSVLIHWGSDAAACEDKAQSVYSMLSDLSDIVIGKHCIALIVAGDSPVFIGHDEHGIYEYIINLIIYYERTE